MRGDVSPTVMSYLADVKGDAIPFDMRLA